MNTGAILTSSGRRLLQQLFLILVVTVVFRSRSSCATANNPCRIPRQLGCHCTNVEGPIEIRCEKTGFRQIPRNLTEPGSLTITGSMINVLQEVFYSSLVALRLEHNGIAYIEDGAFRRLHKLNVLVLAHNSIDILSRDTFRGLRNLELLSLEGNKLLEIKSDVFTGINLPRLGFLKLSHCRIFSLEPNSFAGLQSLYQLNLTGNDIKDLPVLGDVSGLGKLAELDISENDLDAINGSSFQHLSALKHLFMHGNDISVLHQDFVCPVWAKTLKSLWLRRNRISRVEKNTVNQLENLETLDVSFNLLNELDSDEIPWSSIMKILVHNNPWDCRGCTNSWLVKKSVVRAWNDNDNTVTCGVPESFRGISVFESSTFASCLPQKELEEQKEEKVKTRLIPEIVLALSIIVWCFSIAIVVAIVIFRRIQHSTSIPFKKLDNQ